MTISKITLLTSFLLALISCSSRDSNRSGNPQVGQTSLNDVAQPPERQPVGITSLSRDEAVQIVEGVLKSGGIDLRLWDCDDARRCNYIVDERPDDFGVGWRVHVKRIISPERDGEERDGEERYSPYFQIDVTIDYHDSIYLCLTHDEDLPSHLQLSQQSELAEVQRVLDKASKQNHQPSRANKTVEATAISR